MNSSPMSHAERGNSRGIRALSGAAGVSRLKAMGGAACFNSRGQMAAPSPYSSPVSGSKVMCGIMVAGSFSVTRPAISFGWGLFGVKASVLSTSS